MWNMGCEIWDMGYYKTYKDLDVYQLAHTLGVKIHYLSLELPKV